MDSSGPLPQPPRNSDEMYAFEVGVQSIFSSWTVLALAVEHEFGGSRSRERAQLLFEDFLDLFYRKRELSDMEKLWEFLDAELDERLNIELDDNSIEKVLETALRLYETCVRRDFSFLNQLLEINSRKKPNDVIWGGKKVTSWPPKENKAPRTRPDASVLAEDSMAVSSDEDDSGDDDDDGEDEDDDEMQSSAQSAPKPPVEEKPKEPEDDGWTTIGKKGKKGR